ncbi:MAG: SRPBCC domain-containing protein [Thermoanaerobaculia bacterium]
MALTIEETILIAAPPEAVWRLLSDPRTWRLWWPGCVDAETGDRKTLHDGSELRLAVRLGWITCRFRTRVNAATTGKTLVWTGQGAGVTGVHAFYLDPRPNGTSVRQQERFSGAGVLLFRLLRFDRATAAMFRANLRGLKRMAERGA